MWSGVFRVGRPHIFIVSAMVSYLGGVPLFQIYDKQEAFMAAIAAAAANAKTAPFVIVSTSRDCLV